MTTSSAQKIFSLVLAAVGGFILVQGMGLTYYGRFGPGSGFFAIWIGAPLLVLSVLLFTQTFWSREDMGQFFSGKGLWKRPLGLSLACAAVLPTLPLLGFRITMFFFVLLVPFILERQKWSTSLVVASVSSFGIAYVFETLLYLRLPQPSLSLLRSAGL